MLSQIICTSCKAFRTNEINVDVLQKSSYRFSYIKQWSDVGFDPFDKPIRSHRIYI